MERAVEQDNRGVVRMTTLCAGLILLMLSLALGIAAGAVHISLSDIYQAVVAPGQTDNYRIIYTLRMPRAICAALAGANLALSGCILQGILRNPLADPGIIGISAGAGLAAMALMLIAPTFTSFVPFAAFIGAMLIISSLLPYYRCYVCRGCRLFSCLRAGRQSAASRLSRRSRGGVFWRRHDGPVGIFLR